MVWSGEGFSGGQYDIAKVAFTSPARVWIYLEKYNRGGKLRKHTAWVNDTEGNYPFKNPMDNF